MDIIHIIWKDSHTTVTIDFINLICKDMVPNLSIKHIKIDEYETEVNKKTYLEIQRRKLQTYKNPSWVVIAFKSNSINKFNFNDCLEAKAKCDELNELGYNTCMLFGFN